MGTWGTAVFSDDFAADIRGEFKDLIGDGVSADEATRTLLRRHASSIRDQDEAPVFWIALALVQHGLGRLQPDVLAKALEMIDSGADLQRWSHDPALQKKRRAVLEKTKATLLSPPPKPKAVAKRFIEANQWAVGQIVTYRLKSGTLIAFRVIGHHEDLGGRSAVAEVLDWSGTEPPGERELAKAGVLRSRQGGALQFMLGQASRREFPADRLDVLPFRLRPTQKPDGYTIALWRHLDRLLEVHLGFA